MRSCMLQLWVFSINGFKMPVANEVAGAEQSCLVGWQYKGKKVVAEITGAVCMLLKCLKKTTKLNSGKLKHTPWVVTCVLRQIEETGVCRDGRQNRAADPSPPRAAGVVLWLLPRGRFLHHVEEQSHCRLVFCSIFSVKTSNPYLAFWEGKLISGNLVSPVLRCFALIRTKIPFSPSSQSRFRGPAQAAASMARSKDRAAAWQSFPLSLWVPAPQTALWFLWERMSPFSPEILISICF